MNSKWGWINSFGSPWWDVQQQTKYVKESPVFFRGTKLQIIEYSRAFSRPHLFSFNAINSTLHNMKVVDSIGANFALSGGNNIHAYGNLIDARPRPNGGFPFNT